jgi:OHCU decarboxylase
MPQPRRLTLASVNRMGRAEFAAALGGVFEHSQSVAEAAWPAAPFADVAALHRAMVAAVREASPERRLALIRADPDLAGKAARDGTMTPHSVALTFPGTLNDAHKTVLVPYFKNFAPRLTVCCRTLLGRSALAPGMGLAAPNWTSPAKSGTAVLGKRLPATMRMRWL